MVLAEVDAAVSPEHRALVDAVHHFADAAMRPVGVELDRLPDPADVVATSSPPWSIFDKYRQLGAPDGVTRRERPSRSQPAW